MKVIELYFIKLLYIIGCIIGIYGLYISDLQNKIVIIGLFITVMSILYFIISKSIEKLL